MKLEEIKRSIIGEFKTIIDVPNDDLINDQLEAFKEYYISQIYVYLSVDDQKILDNIIEAESDFDDVLEFVSDRINDNEQIIKDIIRQQKEHYELV